ncbi:hypothetical protein [Synechocystis sp. PCC 7509]|uniref:hypothetical protein n=1 Tax=Synechocystis sp. PCC 7509 TaxID=927677 RepID=UPI0002ABA860|nr:hypothetical protein [Synechocystis sp. PCC 7509]
MKSHTFVKVKRPIKPPTSQYLSSNLTPEELIKPTPKVEIEPQEQLEPVLIVDAMLEISRDESVYGCGWSLTELLNEFSGR